MEPVLRHSLASFGSVDYKHHHVRLRMNTKSTFTLFVAAFATVASPGADSVTNATLQRATSNSTLMLTNRFGDWVGQWTNVTVSSACPPWGCGLTFVGITGPIHSPPMSPERRAQRELEHQQRFLQTPPLTERYRVGFSSGTN